MEEEEGVVERIVAGGSGLIRRAKGVCFVRGVLPGERVRFRLTGRERGVLLGELVEILEASAERREPPCPYYDRCGGCEFQEISYEAQLQIKREILREQLRRIGGFEDHPVGAVVSGPPYGYRTRIRLHRGESGAFGFRERGSAEVVPVDQCPVAAEEINAELRRISAAPPELESLRLALSSAGVLRSDGVSQGEVSLLGRTVRFSGEGFFQGNLALFEKLLSQLLRELEASLPSLPTSDGAGGEGGYDLYDLYAGTGAVAAVVASGLEKRLAVRPALVHAVEPDRSSSRFLEENLADYPTRIYRRPVESTLRRLPPPGPWSVVILDPPRAGVSKPLRSFLLSHLPGVVVYVSCDPSTLARDLRALSRRYEIGPLLPFDFFPQTSHVETLVILRPRAAA